MVQVQLLWITLTQRDARPDPIAPSSVNERRARYGALAPNRMAFEQVLADLIRCRKCHFDLCRRIRDRRQSAR